MDGTNPKDAIGDTKPQIHLVPPGALVYMAKVMELGARKYGPMNWRAKPVRYTVYVSAALRHVLSAADGEDTDPESGQPHVAHAAACMAILLDAMATGSLVDDRPTKGAAGPLIARLTEKREPPIVDPKLDTGAGFQSMLMRSRPTGVRLLGDCACSDRGPCIEHRP